MSKTVCIISFLLIVGCNSNEEHYPECMETTWTLTLTGLNTLTMVMQLYNYESGGLFGAEHFDALFTINGQSYEGRVGMWYSSEFYSVFGAYHLIFRSFRCKELSGDATVINNYTDTTYYYYTFTGVEN